MDAKLDRITVNPNVLGGQPCIRGLRFPASRVLSMLAAGQSVPEILTHHPDLVEDDIRQSMAYASALADDRVIVLKSA